MHRRHLLLATALLLPLGAMPRAEPVDAEAEPDDDPPARPHHTVSLARLQGAVAERFPLRFPIQGVIDLDVQVPQLQLLPARNRLGALAVVDAAGPALQRRHQGTLELEFALRYEANDRTLRAHQLRFTRLQFPTLQPGVVALLNGYGQALSERTLLEVVVHRLQAQDLALPDGLGLQPGPITVTDTGLVIDFVPKPPA